ncbi:hypothetical protein [Heyndrickxia acidiproducens]|uniref:hypothetical protein n=1 Tax=Heyndrickxia acidiproducens TaxID=1121084 RepID=UPI00035CBEF0|nr:hypothetical protein [Heyndrickxia acidiproducens]
MKKNGIRLILLGMMIQFIFVSGCNFNGPEHKDSKLALMKETRPAPVQLSNRPARERISGQLRNDVLHFDSIYDVAIIEGPQQTLIAYKVRHLHRFRMGKIEKDLTASLEKRYPRQKFIVSSDYKIFLETVRLQEDMEKHKVSKKQAIKRFKKIIQLKKELT